MTALVFCTDIPPSVNHAYTRTRKGQPVLTHTAKNWIKSARIVAINVAMRNNWTYSADEKVVMRLWAYWPDRRRRDIHNLHKIIADAFEGIFYQDDKLLLIRDEDFIVDPVAPRIRVVIEKYTPKEDVSDTCH